MDKSNSRQERDIVGIFVQQELNLKSWGENYIEAYLLDVMGMDGQ